MRNASWMSSGLSNGRISQSRPRRAASEAALPSVVVPCATQTMTPSMSSRVANPLSAATIMPWPS